MNKPFKTQVFVISITYLVLIIFGILFIIPKLGTIYFWFFIVILALILTAHLFANILTKSKRNRISDLENKIREMTSINKLKINSEDIALNYLPVGILLYDDDSNVVYANAQAKDNF